MKKLLSLALAVVLLASMASMAYAAPITDFDDYQTQNSEMETFCIQHSQGAVDLNVLSNCIDGLLTNDNHGSLQPAVAKEWSSEDGGKTWTFILRDDVTWVDYEGNYMADCIAEDFLWGLEFVLNAAKNEAANTSMPIEMIEGAGEYYKYTAALVDEGKTEEAMNLGLDKFMEMVGMEAVDDYTLVVTCVEPLAYFPTLATYCALSPISGDLLADLGADGYYAVTYDTLWYNGPYTITEYVAGNEKVLTKNESWYGLDANTVFDTVTVHMVESLDTAYQLYQTGEVDYIRLTQSNLQTIYDDEANAYHDYLTEYRPTKYAYSVHFCYDKKLEDGTPDVNWNTAVANTAFRLAWYYGIDWTPYLATTNAINPLNCNSYTYTARAVSTTSDGRDYTSLVLDDLGLAYTDTYDRIDTEKAAAYKAQAIEELTALGVEFPVQVDYYIAGNNQTAKDNADTIKQMLSDYLGDDFVVLNIKTYVSSLANEVRTPQLASFYLTGWGADFGDPINFMGQETYGEDNAYFSTTYSMINNVVDGETVAAGGATELLDTYKTFTEMVGAAKAITDDYDARLAAFAEAETYFVENALVIPYYNEVGWQLTKVNDYSKIYCAYGMQATRYVNWETNDEGYTTADYEAFKAAYESGTATTDAATTDEADATATDEAAAATEEPAADATDEAVATEEPTADATDEAAATEAPADDTATDEAA